jgi:hypothetical protein
MLPTTQYIRVYLPFESWRLGTCDSEAVRAAIQKAYSQFFPSQPKVDLSMVNPANLLRHKRDPVIVKPGMVSLKVISNYNERHRYVLIYCISEPRRRQRIPITTFVPLFLLSCPLLLRLFATHKRHSFDNGLGCFGPGASVVCAGHSLKLIILITILIGAPSTPQRDL